MEYGSSNIEITERTSTMRKQEDSKEIIDGSEVSPIEQIRLTVSNEDDLSLPVWTFQMWFLGIILCGLLSFLNTFFSYRTESLLITMISVQVAMFPIDQFLAKILPTTKFYLQVFGLRDFSLNPGPFNVKEHVLILIFVNTGSGFWNGTAYDVSIVNIIKAFYHWKISFLASWILVITTQVIGYGWAGILRKYVVEPADVVAELSRSGFPTPSTPQLKQRGRLLDDGDCQEQTNCLTEKEEQDGESKSVETTCGNLVSEISVQMGPPQRSKENLIGFCSMFFCTGSSSS